MGGLRNVNIANPPIRYTIRFDRFDSHVKWVDVWKVIHVYGLGTWKYWNTTHFSVVGTWKYWNTTHFSVLGTWKLYWNTIHFSVWEPGNTGNPSNLRTLNLGNMEHQSILIALNLGNTGNNQNV